jgi:hypothetical protein
LKKQKKNFKSAWLLLFALMFSACGRVQIKNSEWCGDMGDLGASCFNTLSDDSRQLSKEQWDRERFGQVCTQGENFSDLKSAIEKLCFMTKRCTQAQKKIIEELGMKIDEFNKEANDYANSGFAP